eukprot:6183461-Pleurochrysis_carterae.AAC.13
MAATLLAARSTATTRAYSTAPPRSVSCSRTSTCTTLTAESTSRGRIRPSATCARCRSPCA